MINKLKILSVIYNIDERKVDEGIGELDRFKNEICIDPDLMADQKYIAVMHEVIHAINNEFTETETECLTQGLVLFMKENPEFIKEIING
jgi:hypothetical protein